jgi:DNA-binding beta-propeller fold protein YncE
MRHRIIILLAIAGLFCACHTKKQVSEKPRQFILSEVWRTDTLLRVPESVIYDAARDVIYVSDMNYGPREKDGNGFISKLSPDGRILSLEWVTGLSSPKGMAIAGNKLYVNDVDEVVVIDIDKGEIAEKIPIPGSKMLNDAVADTDGNVYISDSDNSCIYKLSGGEVTNWICEGVSSPNGLLVDGDRLLLLASMNLSAINPGTKELTVLVDSINAGDGIAYTGMPGYFLVSDWNGEVFLIYPDYSKVSLLNTKEQHINSADIDFIPGRNVLLVPTFFTNRIVAYQLTEKQ